MSPVSFRPCNMLTRKSPLRIKRRCSIYSKDYSRSGRCRLGEPLVRGVVHEEIVALQQQVLSLLHIRFAPDGTTDGQSTFGQRLRQHRKEAQLTQEELSRLAGLSPSLVRKVEQGVTTPTRTTLLTLCAVPELKLVPSALGVHDTGREGGARVAPNWYVPPGFDAVQMINDLGQQLNGSGGNIEQTHVYLDHKSALDWIALCNSGYVAAAREATPLAAAASRLRRSQAPLDWM